MNAPVLADLPSLTLGERSSLPDVPAIYFVLADDVVLYVGQTVNLQQRWLAHHRFTQLNERGGCRIAWLIVDDASLLNELEQACVEHFSPALNGSRVLNGEMKMTLRLSPELHALVKSIADKEHRSLHGQVIRFLEEQAKSWKKER